MTRALVFALTVLVMIGGCSRTDPVRIASKTSKENQILAEMMALLASDQGIPVKRLIPYGNTFDVQEAIKRGRIDLYPEYTGTGASMFGLPAMHDGDQALKAVRAAFEPYALRWLERLGFNNAYAVVMTADRAARWGVERMSDVRDREVTVRLGCEEEYRARPVDGLSALLRHYGWNPAPGVEAFATREPLYRALISERVDVAVVHRTDPQIEEFGLVRLEDDLNFFPVYEAAPLVRTTVLRRHPALQEAIERLAGRIDEVTIRLQNRRTELHGLEPRAVAIEYLVEAGLLDEEPTSLEQPTAVIAVPPLDRRSAALVRALEALRRALPNRRVELRSFYEPAAALQTGEAFVAALGAEHFFEPRTGGLPRRRERIEAVATVGYRAVHLFRPPNDVVRGETGGPFKGVSRLGVGPLGGASHRMARMLVIAYGVVDNVRLIPGDVEAQGAAVERGELDALLLTITPGDAQPTLLMRRYDLGLQAISEWDRTDRQFRYPFLRPARIAPTMYPGLESPVETVSSQLVLAGPRPVGPQVGDGDPMSGIRTQRPPIPVALKRALVEALGETEAIDPTLPGESAGVVQLRREVQPLNPAPVVSALNAAALLGLGVFLYLLLARSREGGTSASP